MCETYSYLVLGFGMNRGIPQLVSLFSEQDPPNKIRQKIIKLRSLSGFCQLGHPMTCPWHENWRSESLTHNRTDPQFTFPALCSRDKTPA